VRDHFDALEAAFQHEYGLHLGKEIWVNHISGRRMMALVTHLPPDSALHRAMEPKAWGWGHEEELLAVLCELVDRHDRHYVAAHRKDGKAPGEPLRVNRPYEREHQKGTTLSELIGLAGPAVKVEVE
jgi:hypothetical protein